MSLAAVYVLTPASSRRGYGCPLFDTAAVSRQRFSPLTLRRPSAGAVKQRGLLLLPRPSIHLLTPSLPTTSVAGSLAAHRHDYRIITMHSLRPGRQVRVFEKGKRWRGEDH